MEGNGIFFFAREDVSINIFACQCEFSSITRKFFIAKAFQPGQELNEFFDGGK
jgi:hypothetical protein